MSSKFFAVSAEKFAPSKIRCGKSLLVIDRKSLLADYVRRTKEQKRLTYDEIASRAGLSISTVNEIANNKHGNVTAPTLLALAKGLGVPEQEIIDIAMGNPAKEDSDWRESTLYELYKRTKTADKTKKKLVDEVIQMLLDRLEKDRAG